MRQKFYKYQGTGNDFVMIDNRQQTFDKNNTKLVAELCDRRFGIGADGLILLENHTDYDFKMVYYNSDGNESTMCGNGGRCLVAFAKQLGVIRDKAIFEAIDGVHQATIANGIVKLHMQDVSGISKNEAYTFLNTGSPHHVQFEEAIDNFEIKSKGAEIRYGDLYKNQGGSNVNFVKKINNETFRLRTYERGVEDETLSCGTGATATAIAMHYIGETEKNQVTIKVEGGELEVCFDASDKKYTNVWLIGPAKYVFEGVI
ncbi:MAG: diaminopimelate epimerase [Jejuia sp.]